MFDRVLEQPRVILVCAFALFLLPALSLFQSRWVEDESWYAIPAYNLLQEGSLRNITFFSHADPLQLDVRPPAMCLAMAASFKVFGLGVIQSRLPSLIAALGVILLTFLLGAELGSPALGSLAALLVSCDTFLFLAARCARPEAPEAFCGVLAVWLYFVSRRRDSVGLAALSGLSIGLAMNFHVNGLAAALVVGGLLIVEFKWRFLTRRRFWATVGAAFLCLVPDLYFLATSAEVRSAADDLYMSRATVPFSTKLMEEGFRYATYIGLTKIGSPNWSVPVRLPVALLALAALFTVFRKNRPLGISLLTMLLPTAAWWLYLVNKSSRYFVALGPILAIAVAAAAIEWSRDLKWRRWVVPACFLFAGSQFAGNLLLVYTYRAADVNQVGAQLRELIPAGHSTWGGITFWIPLHDRQFFSYVRASVKDEVETLHSEYWILNDRVMMMGEGQGGAYADWKELREDANHYAEAHGKLVGKVSNSFYGDLLVYRITYPTTARGL